METNEASKNLEVINSSQKDLSFNLDVKDSKKSLTVLEVVKVLLRERGMKQVELAEMIGMSRQGLHNYLRGHWTVPTQIKLKIAQALKVDSCVIWDL